MKRLSLAPRAQRDIDDVLRMSAERFGADAAHRYRMLIAAALRDLRDDPDRNGVRPIEGAPTGVLAYHLRHARSLAEPDARVAKPRHFIVFRVSNETIQVARVLHDAMDLSAHVGAD